MPRAALLALPALCALLLCAPAAAAPGGEAAPGGGTALPKERRGRDGAPMVLVPAGWFLMGSDEGGPDERPQRRVYLDAFYIDKRPVTVGRFGGAEEDYGPGFRGERKPIVGVSWFLARDFCRSFGKRLPTEAEWEKAARGADGRKYPWGSDWDGSRLIWRGNSRKRTHPVDRARANHTSPYGAMDMAGHVWEWVADRYGEDYYRRAPARNPKGPAKGAERVLRGGSWALRHRKFFRAAHRTAAFPTTRTNDAGFRCAASAEAAASARQP
ncbi:MAG: SUMF1/EgtB/PvdO family nonheme iron enzyme [bacterium]